MGSYTSATTHYLSIRSALLLLLRSAGSSTLLGRPIQQTYSVSIGTTRLCGPCSSLYSSGDSNLWNQWRTRLSRRRLSKALSHSRRVDRLNTSPFEGSERWSIRGGVTSVNNGRTAANWERMLTTYDPYEPLNGQARHALRSTRRTYDDWLEFNDRDRRAGCHNAYFRENQTTKATNATPARSSHNISF